MFWLLAGIVLAGAGLVLAWPLLAQGSRWKASGLALLLILPAGGLLLYRHVGTPQALDLVPAATPPSDLDTLADSLRDRLSERTEDLEGWLLLGRSLKSLQRYDEAVEALEAARRIAPDNPMVKVELAEARLFASGDPRISDGMRSTLEEALAQDPTLQKGLWLLGIDAVQRGDDARAIELWQRLLSLLQPGSTVAASVQEQIQLAGQRLGIETVVEAEPDETEWPGVAVEIAAGQPAVEALPESAVLFLIARPAGESAGPPLGVVRVEQPRFPVELILDDRHSMLPQRRLSGQELLSIKARLSLRGEVGAAPGDWESGAVEVSTSAPQPVSLLLDQEVR